MPCFAALPMPPKYERGTEITSAQGQDTTRKVRARRSHSEKFPRMIDGRTAIKIADTTTVGVCQHHFLDFVDIFYVLVQEGYTFDK